MRIQQENLRVVDDDLLVVFGNMIFERSVYQ